MPPFSARKKAFLILQEVLEKQHSLDQAFAMHLQPEAQESSWIKALCFGILKQRSTLDFIISHFSTKPFSKKDLALKWILYIGVYQLLFMETKPHAAIFETVELSKQVNFQHARGFVNAVLQNILRSGMPTIPEEATYNHPEWLLQKLKQAYPEHWRSICLENNAHPPLFLRVNQRKVQRDEYLKILQAQGVAAEAMPLAAAGILLTLAVDIKKLPYFDQGYFSVQDLAAQQAAPLLALQNGQSVLDACAAPGGKTGHILEMADTNLFAIDQDETRLTRVAQSLTRLQLNATLQVADAGSLDFPAASFDRILLDAPCSGTGVIRRHPDIRFLRQASDIPKLAATQQRILAHLWPMLKPGGILLYATCSILPDENDAVIHTFLSETPKARVCPLHFDTGFATPYGWQFLPQTNGPDGFYYSKLVHG